MPPLPGLVLLEEPRVVLLREGVDDVAGDSRLVVLPCLEVVPPLGVDELPEDAVALVEVGPPPLPNRMSVGRGVMMISLLAEVSFFRLFWE